MEQAVVNIQAGFRGFQTRKQLKYRTVIHCLVALTYFSETCRPLDPWSYLQLGCPPSMISDVSCCCCFTHLEQSATSRHFSAISTADFPKKRLKPFLV